MSKRKEPPGDHADEAKPPGVWNRAAKKGPTNPIRVRTKRLDQVDGDKLALAFWLLANQHARNGTGIAVSDVEARRVAKQFEQQHDTGAKKRGETP